MSLPRIAEKLFGTPLLLQQQKLNNILAAIGRRLHSQADWSAMIEADHVEHRSNADYTVADGVAIIPIIGSLVQRGSYMGYSGLTSYQDIEDNLNKALADAGVKSILLDIDSPGGEVAGAFTLAERLLALRGQKKIVAVANELCASAAYLIGSCADELVLTKTAVVGSIGVVMAHVDYSEAMKEAGVAVTYVYAGAHKVDGNPYQPLPDKVKSDLQAEINQIYQFFVDHVVQARKLKAQAVIDTQARTYIGQSAVDLGLADRVSTIEHEFQRLKQGALSGAGSRQLAKKGERMSDETTGVGEPKAIPDFVAGEALPVVTPIFSESDMAQAKSAGFAEGLKAERDRITGILATGTELNIGNAVMSRLIQNGADLPTARGLMADLKASLDEQTHINTAHGAGMSGQATPKAAIDTQAIYAARNKGGRV